MKRFISIALTACMILSSSSVVSASEEIAGEISIVDAIEESEEVFDESESIEEECDVIDDEISEDEYVVEEESEEIVIDEDIEENVFEEMVEFDARQQIGDYIVNIHADAGVFPEGTTVAVKKVSSNEEARVSDVIEQDLAEGDTVSKTVTFDITFTDSDGIEIEPEDGLVDVSVELADDFMKSLTNELGIAPEDSVGVAVYHVEDNYNVEMVAAVDAQKVEEANEVAFAAEEFSSYSIVIIIHKSPDKKAPVLKSITVKNDKYNKSGKAPEVIAEITDDKSGVGVARIGFYTSATGILLEANLKYNSTDKKYHGTLSIPTTTIPGTYAVSQITIIDKAGNALLYDNEKGKKVPSTFNKKITITDASAGYAPYPVSSFASPEQVNLAGSGTTVTFGAKFYDSTQSTAYGIARLMYTPNLGKRRFRDIEVQLVNRGDSKNLVMAGSISVNARMLCSGTLTLRGVTLVSNRGQRKDYEVVYGTLQKINMYFYNGESSVPKINSIQFAKNKVSLGSSTTKIDVIAKVEDSGNNISKINVVLSDGTNKRIEINNFKKKDSKTYTGTISLSPNQSPGIYKVTYAYIQDKTYNYKVYENTSLTKALKNTKLTVRGDYKYSIEFRGNGAPVGKMSRISDIKSGDEVVLPANAYKYTGYYFKSWNTKADGSGTTIKNKATVMDLGSKDGAVVKLYAQWDIVKYSIKYDANGGKGTIKPQNDMPYDKRFKLRENTFTNGSKPFGGWNTKADGSGTYYKDRQSVEGLTGKNGKVITLYAQWGITEYKVIYKANGGKGSDVKQTVKRNVSFKLKDNPFTYSGKEFICWNTKTDGSGTSYYAGESAKNIANSGATSVTLYAMWQDEELDD